MKKLSMIVTLSLLIPLFLSPMSAGAEFREMRLSVSDYPQMNTRIYGGLVVWEDYRNDPYGGYMGSGIGNPDIYLYNISSRREIAICTQYSGDGGRYSAQQNPDIWENLVVWEDWRNGNADIYIYDLGDPDQPQNGTRLTFSAENQVAPRIWGHYVVWIDYRNGLDGDIYAYDLSVDSDGDGIPNWKDAPYGAGEASFAIFPICENIYEQRDVDISGNIVVWKDYRNDIGDSNRDIYAYDLSERREFQVTSEPHNQFQPAVYGDTVVWVDMRDGFPSIYGKNLSSGEEFRLYDSENPQRYPDIWRDRVVWVETVNGTDVIRTGTLGGDQKTLVSEKWNQRFSAISSLGVAWTDGRHTFQDQYGRTVVVWSAYFLRTSNSPPSIVEITVEPGKLALDEETNLTITAKISDPDGDNITVYVVSELTGKLTMYDDGLHGDGMAGDGIYGIIAAVKPEKAGDFSIEVVAGDEYNATSHYTWNMEVEGEKNPFYVLWGILAIIIVFLILALFVYLIRKKTNKEMEEEEEKKK